MVDAKHQIVVTAPAHGEGQEAHLLAPLIESTREQCKVSRIAENVFKETKLTADAGYSSQDSVRLHSTLGYRTPRNMKIVLAGCPDWVDHYILMRHGKPVLSQVGWLAPAEMERWIEHHNLSEVEADGIPLSSLKVVNSASFIVTSTALRALSSVQALGHAASVADAVFSEAQLPFALWRFPRLPPFVWAAFFRLLWFFGYSRGADSIQVTKTRAKAAAQQLSSFAAKDRVLLVGHGIMNRFIAKELIALGWAARTNHESKYWSASVYGLQT